MMNYKLKKVDTGIGEALNVGRFKTVGDIYRYIADHHVLPHGEDCDKITVTWHDRKDIVDLPDYMDDVIACINVDAGAVQTTYYVTSIGTQMIHK